MDNKVYYGEETKKAILNFGFEIIPFELVKAYAEVKKACMIAINEYEKRFTSEVFSVIIKSIDEIINGFHNEQFVIPLQQGGAGTSINMNINEVIANLACEFYENEYNKKIIINPIEDINRYQSTNDTFPTAVTIVLLRKLAKLEKKIIDLQEILINKENEYQDIIITGRTEMQDALPIRLGQIFASWAGSIERDRWRINKLKERIRTIALGGTAIGTCFFAPKEYVFSVEKHLRLITKLPLTRSQNLTDEIANLDKLSELAGGIKLVSENLFKITGDLLLYSSSFIDEIIHPYLQYGSTIMAAKKNPVILEFIRGISIEVQYECTKISNFTQNGQLQLNPYLPFILKSFIYSFDSIDKAITALIEKFLEIMNINSKKIGINFLKSKALLNSLITLLDYDETKKIENLINNEQIMSIEELKDKIISNTNITKEELDNHFDPINITSFNKENKK